MNGFAAGLVQWPAHWQWRGAPEEDAGAGVACGGGGAIASAHGGQGSSDWKLLCMSWSRSTAAGANVTSNISRHMVGKQGLLARWVRNVSTNGGYHLALSKNRAGASHTSTSAVLALVGGQPWQGALKDKSIISRFETYTTIAQRLACTDLRVKADAATSQDVVAVGDPKHAM